MCGGCIGFAAPEAQLANPTGAVMDDSKKEPQDKPKVVATIDINIDWKSISPREMFLDDYTFCPLCGDELLYTHVTQFIQHEVNEEAHCHSCKIRVKQNTHGLQ